MEETLSNHYKMWTREATTVLIQQYHANECMWMTTSPFYRNKQKRTEALINIAVIVSKLRAQTTAEDIKNKINGIRTQYVSEINKLILAANRGEPYEPTLWCFNMLTFLKPYTQPKQKCNGAWTRVTTTKQIGPYIPASPKIQPRNPYESYPISSLTEQPKINKSLIKTELTDDNEVEIIEEDDVLATDDDFSSHSSYHHEEKSEEDTYHSTRTQKETTITPPPQNGTEDHDYHEQTVKKLFSPKAFSSEITLLPKKIYPTVKRKNEDEIEISLEEKKKKPDQETPTSSSKEEEMENGINIFGKFVMSQMKLVTDKVLLLRLEHTIQNAIIDAQVKQIELDEVKKENDKHKTK